MRTTLHIDDELYREAADLTGVASKSRLVEVALRDLVQRAAARRLARLLGEVPRFEAPRRQRGRAQSRR